MRLNTWQMNFICQSFRDAYTQICTVECWVILFVFVVFDRKNENTHTYIIYISGLQFIFGMLGVLIICPQIIIGGNIENTLCTFISYCLIMASFPFYMGLLLQTLHFLSSHNPSFSVSCKLFAFFFCLPLPDSIK